MKRIGLIGLALLLVGMSVAPAIAKQVRIIRDEYGVPHVYGSTLEATWYGVGYAVGQDRLWQADLLRRLVRNRQCRQPSLWLKRRSNVRLK